MKTRIKINGFIIFVSVMLIALRPSFFLRTAAGTFDDWLKILGMALLLSGLLLRVSSRGYKSEHSRSGFSLVLGGPYQVVRNPMYLGIFSSGAGIILLVFKWWIFYVFIIFMIARYVTLIVKEEKLLAQAFGEEYLAYQEKVPRLFPRFSTLQARRISEYLPLRIRWIRREATSFIALPLLGLGIEWWEDAWLKKNASFMPGYAGLLAVVGLFILFTFFLAKKYETVSDKGKAPG